MAVCVLDSIAVINCFLRARSSRHEYDNLQRRAREYASEMHAGQVRDSGEPYKTHPQAVAKIIEQIEQIVGLKHDEELGAAAELHDVPEDTDGTLRAICEMFGIAVAFLVLGVTKHEGFDSLEQAFCLGHQDWRIVILRGADRLHNMRTLSAIKDKGRRARFVIKAAAYAKKAKQHLHLLSDGQQTMLAILLVLIEDEIAKWGPEGDPKIRKAPAHPRGPNCVHRTYKSRIELFPKPHRASLPSAPWSWPQDSF